MTTVLICGSPALESDLCHTPLWREDLERYVAERADEARMLTLATEPHVVVVDRGMPGADELLASLRTQHLPHPLSIVVVSHGAADPQDSEMASGPVDTVLTLPAGPEWDVRLVEILQVPTRKQARFDVHFDVETLLRQKPVAYRGLALNMSAGGILIESASVHLHPGDDVALRLPIPGLKATVEGRARVVRQPMEERLGLRFEAFSGNGDAHVRDYLALLASQQHS